MMKNDIQPPRTGLNANPVLYGVAAALEELFPPVQPRERRSTEKAAQPEDGTDRTKRD